MKRKRWILGIILILILIGIIALMIISYMGEKKIKESTLLFETEEYKDVSLSQIKSINMIRYTEGGSESYLEETEEEIKETYNYLSKLRVGEETTKACDDNTTVYILQLEENEKTVEIECDWIVINNKRYEIIK